MCDTLWETVSKVGNRNFENLAKESKQDDAHQTASCSPVMACYKLEEMLCPKLGETKPKVGFLSFYHGKS